MKDLPKRRLIELLSVNNAEDLICSDVCVGSVGRVKIDGIGCGRVAGIEKTVVTPVRSMPTRGRIGRGKVDRTVTGRENKLTLGSKVTAETGRRTLSDSPFWVIGNISTGVGATLTETCCSE